MEKHIPGRMYNVDGDGGTVSRVVLFNWTLTAKQYTLKKITL